MLRIPTEPGRGFRFLEGRAAPRVCILKGMNDAKTPATQGRLEKDLSHLSRLLRTMLERQGRADLAAWIPWGGTIPEGEPPVEAERLYTIAFEILNLVEENASAQVRRVKETHDGLSAERGLWAWAFKRLKERDATPEEALAAIRRSSIEPVLTAHPTEARRTTLLEHHRNIYLQLVKLESTHWTPWEREACENEIVALLERLWRTGGVQLVKPTVADEVENACHFLGTVFPDVLLDLDQRLRDAWRDAGWDPAPLNQAGNYPRLSFGSWVGGDRDGHPHVTPAVTTASLLRMRGIALQRLRQRMVETASRLSLSAALQAPLPALQDRIDELAARLGEAGAKAKGRNQGEPWRQLLNLMIAALPVDPAQVPVEPFYRAPSEMLADLSLLRASLVAVGAGQLADLDVLPLEREVATFGFHLARLDVRQNSGTHDKAMERLLEQAGLPDTGFSGWSEEKRLAFIEKELDTPRPFAVPGAPLEGEGEVAVGALRAVATHIAGFGPEGIGAAILSMTRSLSDLLTVSVLSREAGLWTRTPEGWASRVPAVPLFETLDDLFRAPEILRQFLSHPFVRRSLELARATWEPNASRPIQVIMVGYSDSGKDGGIVASQVRVRRTQELLVAVADELGVDLRIFHGRGGTISRGAGPTDRFLRALPPQSLVTGLRVTEQGETISQKYANRITARYNLELLTAGAVAAAVRRSEPVSRATEDEILSVLEDLSQRKWRSMVEHEEFAAFFGEVTPLDVIERARIGSRPSRRSGRRSVADLRAIPWVFAWSQSRFLAPGWYGAGTALETLRDRHPDLWGHLRRLVVERSFPRFLFNNIEASVHTGSEAISRTYGELADPRLGAIFLPGLFEERARTVSLIEELFGAGFEVHRPKLSRSLRLRDEPLELLHARQIGLLRQWRPLEEEDPRKASMLEQLLGNVNAIAAGLRTTG
jgi:phosphoenolpyruvate carboxylase